MAALITTGCQSKGGDSDQFALAFFYISKRAADRVPLQSLDPRVNELAFLWRVDGDFGRFEGAPVENFKTGRSRDWISIDWLIKIDDWKNRTVPQIVTVLQQRVTASVSLIAEGSRRRGMRVEAALLADELTGYANEMASLASRLDPMAAWIPPGQRKDPSQFCDPPLVG